MGVMVTSSNSRFTIKERVSLHKGENLFEVEYAGLPLAVNQYRMHIGVYKDEGDCTLDVVENALVFDVIEDDVFATGKYYKGGGNIVDIPQKWSIL